MRILLVISLFLSGFAPTAVYAQTILKQNGKFGLSDEDGTVVLEPKYDTVEQSYFVSTTPNLKRQIVLYKIPAEAPLFFVKQNGKFAYAYKMSIDSTKRMKQELVHWYVSEFEFDSLVITSVGSSYYYNSYGFTTMIYKKNGKWGMIYIQTHTGSGGGMFPSAGFYADVMGKQYRTETKYDTIFRSQLDFFHPTFLNGKYGLINPVSGEEYSPEFDTIPVYMADRKRRVKKNGKWGVIELVRGTRSLKYLAPCQCNKVGEYGDNIYACVGAGDTIKFFDAVSNLEFIPKENNMSLVLTASQYVYIGWLHPDNSTVSMLIAIRPREHKPYGEYDRIYLFDLAKNRLVAFNDSAYKYEFFRNSSDTVLIARYKPAVTNRTVHYEFFNVATQELRFVLDLDSSYSLRSEVYSPSRTEPSVPHIIRFYSQDKYLNQRTIGYYNYRTEKFSKRKPRRKQLR